MSILRLPTLDRPSLGLSRRFNILSSNTASSSRDDVTSSMVSLKTLPSVEQLDSDDFLSMFDESSDSGLPEQVRSTTVVASQIDLPELSSTPPTSRFPELHGSPSLRSEPAQMTSGQEQRAEPGVTTGVDQGQMVYRSSISSSVPSTKKSNASSRPSRKSSMSSMTEGLSSSERSMQEFEKEKALHERLKRRSREKGVSFGQTNTTSENITTTRRASTGPQASLNRSDHGHSGQPEGNTLPHQHVSANPRPCSRGNRLGQAMSDGLSVSPPPTPKAALHSSAEQFVRFERPTKSNTSSRRTSSRRESTARLSRILTFPPVDNVDRVRVSIMSHLTHVDDLQACALVSKDFYQAFEKYEITLVDCVLFNQSSAAWELRHSVRHLEKPSPFRLRSVQRDIATVHALEDFIVWRCESMLRPASLLALLGQAPERKAELEDAIWMIWSFCNSFGKTAMSDANLLKHTQWLNGGVLRQSRAAICTDLTRSPCSTKQLEDMSEIWRCLETLLSGFKGREEEARQAGVFDNATTSKSTDCELLNAWVHDVLSLGPKAVLTLSSCDFEQARVLGITRWSPPAKGNGRSTFLKAAIEEVYRERLMKEARQKAQGYRKTVQHHHKRSVSDPSHIPGHASSRLSLPPVSHQSLRLETRNPVRQSMSAEGLTVSQAPLDIRPDCDPLSAVNRLPTFSPSINPMIFSPLSITKNASTRLGATLFPMQNRDQSQRYSIALSSLATDEGKPARPSTADVTDPTDLAVALMIQEMGFSEGEAKRALAMSDTGSGINVQRAVELLATDSVVPPPKQFEICELPASVGDAKLARKPNKRDICEGNCKPMLVVEPRRERVSGLGMVKRGLSYRMSFRKSTRLSVILDDDEGTSTRTSADSPESNRDSVLPQFTISTTSAFTSTRFAESTNAAESKDTLTALPEEEQEQSPVSPVTPVAHNWSKQDSKALAVLGMTESEQYSWPAYPPKPRITLQRVGTGVRKSGWSIPGWKRKEQFTQPEIIGYAY